MLLIESGKMVSQWYSLKLWCPVALACSRASFSPFTPIWHTPQRSVKLTTSVNCLASWHCSQTACETLLNTASACSDMTTET